FACRPDVLLSRPPWTSLFPYTTLFRSLRIFTEEMLAGISAAVGFVILHLAIDYFVHALLQQAGFVFFKQTIPAAAPQHLDNVPAGTTEYTFEFLDDLAVAAYRPVETLQVTVDDEDKVVEFFAGCQRNCSQAFRLVTLTVTKE